MPTSVPTQEQKTATAKAVGLMFQLNQAILGARNLGVNLRVSLLNAENQEQALVTTRGFTLDTPVPLV